MNQISFLIDRHIRTSDTDKTLLRFFWERMKDNNHVTPHKRDVRHEMYRYALEYHQENKKLFSYFRL